MLYKIENEGLDCNLNLVELIFILYKKTLNYRYIEGKKKKKKKIERKMKEKEKEGKT